MKNFETIGLPKSLLHTLTYIGFHTPTPIQIQAIPPALNGQDILGSAQTGTGKTAAFGIPLVAKLICTKHNSALVMTPTRELATQVMQQLQKLLGKKSNIKTTLLIGGEPLPKQIRQIKQNPRLIVGTPGRINDHLVRGNLELNDTDFLVLDETDRMLDMGFSAQIEKIINFMPEKKQVLLFSATLPENIKKISSKYLNNPAYISIKHTNNINLKIKQEVVQVSINDKYKQLLIQLDKRQGTIIVFVKTRHNTEKIAEMLSSNNYSVAAIHGNLHQRKRDSIMKAFRKQKYRILIATDIAARGLDIPHIEHVINYDLPQCPEDYIHRIGRTARAGATGSAICIVTPADKYKWNSINSLINGNSNSDKNTKVYKTNTGKCIKKPYAKKKYKNKKLTIAK
ncbi:Superfamily II DNA and RNA helicase [Candidatus Xenohaliotis californiensis]|uniref:Superfamily II DNA and RNA helicase n=1 Tax=Candidatus Xenohaliotis californiensis TaxID=84677 RepID=A0ABP0ETG5_9RICK|nr:Superfamily II DNA and RNA helicase [Candidatus Xenohaliotis californiensis]